MLIYHPSPFSHNLIRPRIKKTVADYHNPFLTVSKGGYLCSVLRGLLSLSLCALRSALTVSFVSTFFQTVGRAVSPFRLKLRSGSPRNRSNIATLEIKALFCDRHFVLILRYSCFCVDYCLCLAKSKEKRGSLSELPYWALFLRRRPFPRQNWGRCLEKDRKKLYTILFFSNRCLLLHCNSRELSLSLYKPQI